MPEQLNLEQAVRDLVNDLCAVLYEHGYQKISVGALMRVIGVAEEQAVKHDQEIIDLLHHFEKQSKLPRNTQVPPGATFH
jgi:hypothetical protein